MTVPPAPASPQGATPPRPLRGVPRWPALIAVLLIALAFVFVPEELSIGPRWLVPALVLFFGAVTRLANYRASAETTHRIALAVNGSICAAVVGSAVTLITEGLFGGMSPRRLLAGAALIWGLNVFAFALVYWTMDGGGPAKRRMEGHVSDDFIFPQMTRDDPRCNAWHPHFLDYLFLSFNTSTAFSPTDTLVLSRPAKVLFMVQSVVSLTVIAVLVARGINTLTQ